jgi:hypothetical protein
MPRIILINVQYPFLNKLPTKSAVLCNLTTVKISDFVEQMDISQPLSYEYCNGLSGTKCVHVIRVVIRTFKTSPLSLKILICRKPLLAKNRSTNNAALLFSGIKRFSIQCRKGRVQYNLGLLKFKVVLKKCFILGKPLPG